MSLQIHRRSRIGRSQHRILVWEGFLTSEVTAPVEVFGAAIGRGALPGTNVLLVSTGDLQVTSNEGLRILADTTIDQCPPLEVLIVPSSADMAPVIADKKIVAFVAEHGSRVQHLASNCAGAFLLGKAGLLDERRVTTYPGGETHLQASTPRAHVVEDDVVEDGNLITSSGALVSYNAALVLLEALTDSIVTGAIMDDLYYQRLLDLQAI